MAMNKFQFRVSTSFRVNLSLTVKKNMNKSECYSLRHEYYYNIYIVKYTDKIHLVLKYLVLKLCYYDRKYKFVLNIKLFHHVTYIPSHSTIISFQLK